MQGLLSIFKSRYFWMCIGFVLLVALTFVVGAWLEWSMTLRLLIVIALLVVLIGVIAVEVVRASRSAAQIEQSIKMQAEQQRMSTRPDKQAEIEELQERLEEAITKLKNSKLGRGRRGRNALHALPWYLFIGPPGAGKTTAIQNSGLNFPVGTDRIRGVGGTRNCDWFFSDQAILLDTAGRYMTEKEDTEEWYAFLDTLKNHRKGQPINGVIVGISMAELIDASPEEIEWHANNIRRRTSELVERLGVRFPVYLAFTKCDLLQGFVEFFGDLTRQEREQIWGCTFTDEQREDGDPRDLFEEEFDHLVNALVDARTGRLSRSMKRAERQKVYVFPLEFASAKDNLARFVSQLFQPNPYQENPEFRGFYLTSGTQEGAPIDRVIQSMAEQFDFASGLSTDTEPQMEAKTYFIKDLFTDVIIPDQYLVEQTSRSARRGQLARAGTMVASLALLGLFVLGLSQAVVRSRLDLNRVQEAAAAAAPVRWEGATAVEALDRVDQLREQVSALASYEEDPPFLRWGLYRGGTVLEPAQTLYFQKTRALVRILFESLDRQLATAQGGTLEGERRQALYDDLKAYLLLTEESARLSNPANRTFLGRHLVEMAVQPSGPVASAELRERGGQVEQQIAAFAEGIGNQTVDAFEARTSVVERVRRIVYQPPTIETVYGQLEQEGENLLEPLVLADIVPREYLLLFEGQPEVSGFFTKTGWDTFVRDAIDQEGESPDRVDWVMGQDPEDLPEALRNREQVAEQLREIYFGEYAAAWRQFLSDVRYRPFRDMRDAAQSMSQLGDPYDSPLLWLLAQTTSQTTFEVSALEEAQGAAQDVAERRAEATARQQLRTQGALQGGVGGEEAAAVHPVNRRFAWLHALKATEAASGGAPANLTRTLEALQNISGTLAGLEGDPPGATEFAAQVLEQNGGALASGLRTLRNTLSQFDPEARRELFEQPILSAWSVVLAAAQRHLNERWRAEVYRPFQSNLASAYPFDANSPQGAALVDVESFFHPQTGAVALFVEEQLRPFLDEDQERARTWEGRGIGFASATARLLAQADRIGAGLFSGGGLQLVFEMQPELPTRTDGAPSVAQVFTSIHGQDATYRMGNYRPWTEFVWPGRPEATLIVTTREGQMEPLQFEGEWAWFRMLQAAQVQQRTTTEYRIRWSLEQPGRYAVTAHYNLRSRIATDLFANPQGFFRLRVPETIN